MTAAFSSLLCLLRITECEKPSGMREAARNARSRRAFVGRVIMTNRTRGILLAATA